MDPRAQRHALLFSRLVEKCGGVPRIVSLKVTRLGATHLYRCCDPLSGCWPTSDVIEDLQLFCGEPTFTAALAESMPSQIVARDLMEEACEASVSAGELLKLVLEAKAHPGGPTPRMREAIAMAVDRIAEELREVRCANDAGCTPARRAS